MITSGGVTNAAKTRIPTTAYLRTLASPCPLTSPALPINVRSTGSWKHKPKAMMNFNVISRLSLTFPKNVMRMPSVVSGITTSTTPGTSVETKSLIISAIIDGTSAKPRKKFIANGVTIKCAKDAPRMNIIGDEIINGKNACFSFL